MARSSAERRSGTGYELAEDFIPVIQFPNTYTDLANREIYRPTDKQRIGKSGSWVMITRKLPPIEGGFDKHMRVGMMFFIQQEENSDEAGFLPDGTYKVLCPTVWGTVHLWPYEYSTIETKTIIEMWQLGEIIFHPTNIDAARFNEIVFYARSRGIGTADAMVMALGTIEGPIGWFEPASKEMQLACESMEQRVHGWRPRRRKGRKP